MELFQSNTTHYVNSNALEVPIGIFIIIIILCRLISRLFFLYIGSIQYIIAYIEITITIMIGENEYLKTHTSTHISILCFVNLVVLTCF